MEIIVKQDNGIDNTYLICLPERSEGSLWRWNIKVCGEFYDSGKRFVFEIPRSARKDKRGQACLRARKDKGGRVLSS